MNHSIFKNEPESKEMSNNKGAKHNNNVKEWVCEVDLLDWFFTERQMLMEFTEHF